jgi:putative ABC transport system permease protein
MLRLVINDLAENLRIWVGALVVTAAAAAALSVAIGLLQTGAGAALREQLALTVLASAVIVFSVVATTVVISSVTRLTITLQRRSYALWQLIGVAPALVVTVVRGQLVIVALFGAVLGIALTAPFVPAFLEFGLSASSGLQHVHGRFDLVGALWTVGAVVLIVWLSGLRPSRRAARVRAIEALRNPSPRDAGMTWGRWFAAALTLLLAGSMLAALTTSDPRTGGSSVLLIGPMLTACAAAFGPLLFPFVLQVWTRIVPDRVSPSWFLARTTVAYDVSRSSATISAMLIVIALPGSIYAGFFTYGRAIGVITGTATSALAPQSFLLMLSGALLLSLVGAASTVAMASQTRARESALVQAAGGTTRVVVTRAAWEAVMHVGTAAIVAVGVLIATGAGEALALNVVAPGTIPAFGAVAALPAALVGLVLVLGATVVPTLLDARRTITAVLATE